MRKNEILSKYALSLGQMKLSLLRAPKTVTLLIAWILLISVNVDVYATQNTSLEAILQNWRQRQLSYQIANYSLKGRCVIPQGTYDFMLDLPEGIKKPVPSSDYEFEREVDLTIDFELNKVRRCLKQENFYISKAKFIPEVYVELYDGSEYQQYMPREENIEAGREIWKFQPELYERKTDPPPVFFEPIDYPILYWHGVVPGTGSYIQPENIRIKLDNSAFQHAGTVQFQGRTCVILKTKGSPGSQKHNEYWVDVERDYNIVRRSRYKREVEISNLMIEHLLEDNKWVPKKWTLTTYTPEGKMDMWTELSVQKTAFNTSVSPDTFHVTPKPGTIIANTKTGERYVKGKPGQPNMSLGEYSMASNVNRPIRWPFVICSAVIFVILVLIVCRKHLANIN